MYLLKFGNKPNVDIFFPTDFAIHLPYDIFCGIWLFFFGRYAPLAMWAAADGLCQLAHACTMMKVASDQRAGRRHYGQRCSASNTIPLVVIKYNITILYN